VRQGDLFRDVPLGYPWPPDAERWVIVDRLGADKRPIDPDTAYALAGAAFDGISEENVTAILQKTTILDGAHVIDPGRVYAWCAIV
jgi:hypothetical protein